MILHLLHYFLFFFLAPLMLSAQKSQPRKRVNVNVHSWLVFKNRIQIKNYVTKKSQGYCLSRMITQQMTANWGRIRSHIIVRILESRTHGEARNTKRVPFRNATQLISMSLWTVPITAHGWAHGSIASDPTIHAVNIKPHALFKLNLILLL